MAEDVIIVDLELKELVEMLRGLKMVGAGLRGMDRELKAAQGTVSELAKEQRAYASSVRTSTRAVKSLAQAQQGLQKGTALVRVAVAPAGGASAAQPAAQQARAIRQQAPYFPQGPAQRLQKAAVGLANAQRSGDPARIFDAQHAYRNAHRSLKSAHSSMQPTTFAQRFMKVLSTSRFSVGGGGAQLMPLVGRTLAAIGPEFAAIAGAVAAVGAAAVLAAKAVYDMAEKASAAGTEFLKMRYASGGTGEQTAQLDAIGKALGGMNLNGASREFADNISHNGMAAVAANQYGVQDYGTFDSTNKADKYLRFTKGLINDPNEQNAIRTARMTGTENLLPLRQLSGETKQNLFERDPAVKAGIMDSGFQKSALEFQVSLGRVGEAFGNLNNAIIKPLLPGLAAMANGLANITNGMAKWLGEHQGLVKGIWSAVSPFTAIIAHWRTFTTLIQLSPIGMMFRLIGAGFTLLGAVFQGLWNGLQPLVTVIKQVTDAVGAAINGFLAFINDGLLGFDKAVQVMALNLKGIVETILGDTKDAKSDWAEANRLQKMSLADWKKEKDSEGRHADSMDRHADALDENTKALRNGVFGGGERSRSAIPERWAGSGPRGAEVWVGEAARLGAFAL